MEKDYVFLREYGARLIEKGKCFPDVGICNGKLGIAICLFHLNLILKDDLYKKAAFELIDEAYENISVLTPVSFEYGLSGIGCGFQYLINNGFVDADGDDVLSEIDAVVKNVIDLRSLHLLDFKNGICGVGYYLYHRLKERNTDDNNIVVLKLKEYLIYLIDWMEHLLLNTDDMNGVNDAYFLLCRLHKLNVFNYKVERLLNFCSRKLIDFNLPVSDTYRCLGMQSLKVLSPWISRSINPRL